MLELEYRKKIRTLKGEVMMNEKVEKLLDLMIKGVETGSELLGNELPKLAQEILEFEFYAHMLGAVVGCLVSLGLICLGFLVYKREKDIGVSMFLVSFITLCHTVIPCYTMLKIKLAPKVYVIEYVKGMK